MERWDDWERDKAFAFKLQSAARTISRLQKHLCRNLVPEIKTMEIQSFRMMLAVCPRKLERQ